MTRSVCAVAAFAAGTLAAEVSFAQTWEIHQYFGVPTRTPPVTAVGFPDQIPVVTVFPGETVYLPVFIRMQRGNSTLSPQLLHSFLYGLSGIVMGDASPLDFTAAATNQSLGAYTDPLVDISPAGPDPPQPAPPGNFNLINNMGYQSSVAGSSSLMGSIGQTLPPTDPPNNAWWVGTIAISIALGTPLATGIDLYFRTGQLAGGAPYVVTDQTIPATTVAYGWDASANAPDFHLFGSTTPLNGRVEQRFSTFPDAIISLFVPEPAAIGCLVIGLRVVTRRRRKARCP